MARVSLEYIGFNNNHSTREGIKPMNTTRRTVLKGATASSVLAGLIAAGALRPTQVLAAEWNKAAFEAHETTGALKGLGAGTPANLWHAPGCPQCSRTGYAGRTGIYDIAVRVQGGRQIALFRGKSHQIGGDVITGPPSPS